MIFKKIINKKKGSKISAIGSQIDYILNTHVSKSDETKKFQDINLNLSRLRKCVYWGCRCFVLGVEKEIVKMEMIALAYLANRSQNPVNHYVISWPNSEQPMNHQIDQAVDIFIHDLGLDDHKLIYGLHVNTKYLHVHILVCRAHPITGLCTEINRGFDILAAHKAISKIEYIQGWKPEINTYYNILDSHLSEVDFAELKDSSFKDYTLANNLNYLHLTSDSLLTNQTSSLISKKNYKKNDFEHFKSHTIFKKERTLYNEKKRNAKIKLSSAFNKEKTDLKSSQKKERDDIFSGNWHGIGLALNLMRSLLATKHAEQLFTMKERHNTQREKFRREFPPFPDYSNWLNSRGKSELIDDCCDDWHLRNQIKNHKNTIMCFQPISDSYDLPHESNFVLFKFDDHLKSDIGSTDCDALIYVENWRDIFTTFAALQYAAQKWKKFKIFGEDEFIAMCAYLTTDYGFNVISDEILNKINSEYESKKNQFTSNKQIRIENKLNFTFNLLKNKVNSVYQFFYNNIIKQISEKNIDLSRIDSVIAVQLRISGFCREEVKKIIHDNAAQIRKSLQIDRLEDYARRAADYAFSVEDNFQELNIDKIMNHEFFLKKRLTKDIPKKDFFMKL
ncbi:relaxase/mobilization nuclease domain-containing protein [Desulfonatronum thioautotrophicum]|uniref:relaxase/mobilization nuclease domain-containing protein n=1 Tax=Desulfonatronum thioautotrophicum TaxID=617001 RepID=UPI0005EB60E0|nr:relaxase/mobilization nuclease domain-containing protein [Desulfonatronum thioautotrophicum]